ncbi:MAG TPA: diguanylate cyclase, partial [Verrucomicrobiae bacterium]|nr:diguanylate cyclase [Verrucomicrobiae bacterium]
MPSIFADEVQRVTAVLRKNLSLLLPFLPLLAAGLALPRVGTLSPALRELLPHAPLAAAGVAILLSMRFHRGRVFLAACVVAACWWGYREYLQDGVTGFRETVAYLALVVVAPFDIFLFSLMSEKGVGSNGGILRIIFLLLQVSLLEWVARFHKSGLVDALLFPLLPLQSLQSLALPQLSLLAAGFYLLVMLARLRSTGCSLIGVFAAVIVSLLAAAERLGDPVAFTLFSSSAALVLVLGLLQESYNLAFRDELTGLPSRRALNERLASLGRRYTVAMVDVDHFKSFND